MPRWLERTALLISDVLGFNLAFILIFVLRFHSGMYMNTIQLAWSDMGNPAVILTVFWVFLFGINAMYAVGRTISRSDEFLNIAKYVFIGIFLIYLITVDLDNPVTFGKSILVFYATALVVFLGVGRMLIRTLHQSRLSAGKGLANTLIVGLNRRGVAVQDEFLDNPVSGYRLCGVIAMEGEREEPPEEFILPVLGNVDDLPQVIETEDIEEVILALDHDHHDLTIDVISLLQDQRVGIKTNPDMYDAISGLARTQQLYGLPLIDIMPDFMPLWEKVAKRVLDISVAMVGLALSSPLMVIIAAAIKADTSGPIFYSQERVGRRGEIFKVHKFRTMVQDAEHTSGPVWAAEEDPRITRVGRFLRKARLDEIPQFYNVLKNDMSLVGPRPERPFFVQKITELYPLYPRRHRVKPGITGWAQVKHTYDTTLEASRLKLKYDLFYLENISLRLDFKILIYTLYVMLSGKGSR